MRQARACRRQVEVAVLVVGLGAASGASAVDGPIAIKVGTEFQVSSSTASTSVRPAVAADADGDFVVAWEGYQDNGGYSVIAKRFDSVGAPQGTDFQVNSQTEYSSQPGRLPAIARGADGDFTIVWRTLLCRYCVWHLGVYPTALFGRRYDATGAPESVEFQINSTPGGYHQAALAANSDGGVVVVWQNLDGVFYDPSGDVFARRFDSAGAPEGAEFQVNTATTTFLSAAPAVAVDGDGDFVVVWMSAGSFGFAGDVFARRFDASGTGQGPEFLVNAYTAGSQSLPVIASDAAGNVTIAWQSNGQDGSSSGIFARQFDSTGSPLGWEFQINSYTAGSQRYPAIGSRDNGAFIVTWESADPRDGSVAGVFARAFDSAGTPLGVELQVNSYTVGSQSQPAISFDAAGHFVAVWQSDDALHSGIFGQRFGLVTPAPLDLDADGAVEALTDALLALRSMFGFTGTSLTEGAVGAGCNRCDADSIGPYIGGQDLALDVDGNGAIGALTDGVLVMRYLFGFSGEALTAGAVAVDCTRCDATTIVPYLQSLD